jgi:hypothetical protein
VIAKALPCLLALAALGAPAAAFAAQLTGTSGPDRLSGTGDVDVVYARGGSDVVRALGGKDVVYGDGGRDELSGGAGADTLDGGEGRDAFAAGEGDDLIDAADGKAEVVDCGGGQDLVAADRLDALIGCESPALAGPAATRAAPDTTSSRVRFRAPVRGRYRVLWLEAPCAVPTTPLGILGAGARTITLEPPACPGAYRAAIALAPSCPRGRRCVAPPPLQPVARLDFSVR